MSFLENNSSEQNKKLVVWVKAKPFAKEEKIEKIDDNHFAVWVKEPPIKGKANEAIKNALAVYFKTASSRVKIVSGYSSREKIFEIIKFKID